MIDVKTVLENFVQHSDTLWVRDSPDDEKKCALVQPVDIEKWIVINSQGKLMYGPAEFYSCLLYIKVTS